MSGFQSLVGVYGFCGHRKDTAQTEKRQFQSLVGVYGFCGKIKYLEKPMSFVSIPSRGLWFLRRWSSHPGTGTLQVSIPSRGLWFLRLYKITWTKGGYYVSIPSRGLWFLRQLSGDFWLYRVAFQSLVGVYGFCGVKLQSLLLSRICFNP